MLLPDKHVRMSESVLGVAGLVYDALAKPMSLDDLIDSVALKLESEDLPAPHSTETATLALCFLHSVNLVDVKSNGDLFRCD